MFDGATLGRTAAAPGAVYLNDARGNWTTVGRRRREEEDVSVGREKTKV